MLEICVGEHCLLIEIDPYGAAHTTVKDFFEQFFTDDSFVFVGVGFKDVMAKIRDEYENNTDFKGLFNIKNVIDLRELVVFEGLNCDKCKLEKLIKVVLDVEYDRPTDKRLNAEDGGGNSLSDELVLWSGVEVFLIRKMGTYLLNM